MRVSAIGIENHYLTNKNFKCTNPSEYNHVNFKGIEAGAKSLIGTALGIGIGALITTATGGLAAPLFLGIFGCTAGSIKGSRDEVMSGKSDEGCIDSDNITYYA